jgi:uncharacterized protein (TIGR03083 family)
VDWHRIGPPLDVRPLFPVERAALLGLLADLPPGAWSLPTPCAGWDVHDVVAHVVHDQLRRLSGHRDGQPGLPGPDGGESLPGYLSRVNGQFVEAARAFSPRVLIDLLTTLGPQLDDLWASLDLAAMGPIGVWWADPQAPAPIWLDVAREYTEFWVHQQHVREAVGLPGADGADLAGPVVDTFLRALPRTLRATSAPEGTLVAIDVTTPVDRVWLVRRDAAGWSLAPADGAPADGAATAARLALSPDTLWRVATGAIDPATARGRCTVQGDEQLARAVLHIVSIIR